MTDAELRELRSRALASGSVADEAAYLLERVRVGDLERDRLLLAAYCEDPAAQQALGSDAPRPGAGADLFAWMQGLDLWADRDETELEPCPWRKDLAVRANLLAAQHVALDEDHPRLARALLAGMDWLDCPCEGHALEAERASDAALRVAGARPDGEAGRRAWAMVSAAGEAGDLSESRFLSFPSLIHAARVSSEERVRTVVREGLIPWLLDSTPLERMGAFRQAVAPVPERPVLHKPESKDDLRPPFSRIGDSGWAERVRDLLDAYGVPLPDPVSGSELDQREASLGVQLPPSLRRFLTEIGPLDPDGIRILSPPEIVPMEQIWFRDRLGFFARRRLRRMVAVADYLGTGDLIGLEIASGRVSLCSHDPLGFSRWLPDFDALIKMVLIDLARGRYGWPDEVDDLVASLKRELFGFVPF